MRPILLTLLGVASVGAAAASEGDTTDGQSQQLQGNPSLDMPSYSQPARAWRVWRDGVPAQPDEECRHTIRKVRAANGQPELERPEGERRTADADEPMVLWAVDRREEGCSMLVVKGDPSDVRPIPEVDQSILLRPAR